MARTTRYCATCLTTFFENPERCTNLTCGAAMPDGGWGVLLGPGDLLDRHYLVERVLAVGGAGLTYLARESDGEGHATGPLVAIKVLYTARDTGPFLRRLSNEAQILQELSHPHIVHCLGFVHRAGYEPYLVTRFEEGGSLQQHVERVGPLPTKVAVAILRQVLLALDVAHQRAVVHRDLKPDNVLLDRRCGADEVPHVRVADFGIAKVHGGLTDRITKLGSFVGTPEYAAPEQFEGLPPTPATDLFAAGGLLWFLLTGRAPVKFSQRHDLGTSYDELLEQVPPRFDQAQTQVSDAAERDLLQDVLDHLMATEGEARWTVHQVLHRLLPLGDTALTRGASTLEVTGSAAPTRTGRPTATLDTTGALPPPELAPAGETAVPTAGSTTMEEEGLGDAEDTFEGLGVPGEKEGGPARPAPSVEGMDAPAPSARVADTVPPPPPDAPPPPVAASPKASGTPAVPPSRSEPRPRPEPAVAATPEPAGSTAWVPRAELVGDGLTPGPAPRKLPDVAATADLPERPVPSPPPTPLDSSPAPQPGPAPVESETSMAGGAVQAAGCLGLSVVSVTVTAGLGLAVTAAVLLGAAWGLGWFQGPVTTDPLVVRAEPPHRWAKAPQLLGSGGRAAVRRHAVQNALSKRSGAIGRRCSAKGHAVVELLYEPDGTIVYAMVDEGWLDPKERACVERELSGFALGVRIPKESRVRVAVPLE